MELKLDLTKRDKNTQNYLIVGLVFVVVSIGYIASKYFNGKEIETLDWGYVVPGMAIGITYFVRGLKERLKKAYFIINDQQVTINQNDRNGEKTFRWADVERIDITASKCVFILNKGGEIAFTLVDYEKDEIKQIKDAIKFIASKHNIPYSQIAVIE